MDAHLNTAYRQSLVVIIKEAGPIVLLTGLKPRPPPSPHKHSQVGFQLDHFQKQNWIFLTVEFIHFST